MGARSARARLWSVYLLDMLGGSTGPTILTAEPLAVGYERLTSADHPDMLPAFTNLGYASKAAGRIAEAIPLHERTLPDYERVFGADHPTTKAVRQHLDPLTE